MPVWIVYSLVSALFYSSVNHLDKYLVSKVLKGRTVGTLVLFSSMIGFLVTGILYVWHPSVMQISTTTALLLITTGILYVANLICYFYALEQDDVSVVAPMYQTVPVLALILGLLLLNEAISLVQFVAGVIVMAGAVALSSSPWFKDFKVNKRALFLMFGASFFTALNATLFKVSNIDEDNFIKLVFWEYIGFIIAAIWLFVFVKSYRIMFLKMIRTNGPKVMSLNLVNEVLATGANVAIHMATLLSPLAVALWVAEGAQPLFVVLTGILIAKLFPKISGETTDRQTTVWRILCISLMLVGTYLLL